MKRTNYLWMIVAGATVFASCTGELKERVEDLEERVEALEGQFNGDGTNNKPVIRQNVNTGTPAEPEVKPEGPLPAFSFETADHDFGTITDGDIVEKTFKFTNTGEVPLIISNATATCGCTVPNWTREPVPAGKKGEVQVRFNSRNRAGIQNKTITITANTYPTTHKLRIKANVLKAAEDSE